MEKEIPKIDLPQDWLIGKLSADDKALLSLYANYPCRLKAGIFVLCLGGEVEASINLTRFKVEPGCFITIFPETIFQIQRIEGDLRIYFMGFSNDFLKQPTVSKLLMDMHYAVKNNPIYRMTEKAVPLMSDYFELLIKTYEFCGANLSRSITNHLFSSLLIGINAMYKDQEMDNSNLSRAEQIGRNFTQLVMQNYTAQRNVAWYAQRMGISQAHLSTIVKQATGKTCIEIISAMVIMDAKAQLKSTQLTVQEIAYALNFANMSFFGKYFKRHVGIGPQEYRSS